MGVERLSSEELLRALRTATGALYCMDVTWGAYSTGWECWFPQDCCRILTPHFLCFCVAFALLCCNAMPRSH